MTVNTKKINGANSEISATIDAKLVDAKIEKIAKNLSKTAKVAGFRAGKVPMAIIKKQYGERLIQDAESEALRDVFEAGVKSLGFTQADLIGEPNVTKFEKTGETIEVLITVANRPAFDLGDYTALVPEVEKPKITKKAVADRIKDLAEAQADFVDVTDRAVESGDTVVIDFEGSIDGELFPGGKAEGFSLKIGSGQFIPGFEDQIIGMNTGEERTIKVSFPEDYQAPNLAGKEADFKINLQKIQTKEKVRVDKKLAEKMLPGEKDADVEMLNQKVEEQLQSEELSKLYNDEVKPKLMETFIAHYTFDMPEFIVEQEMDNYLNRKAQTMTQEEIEEIKNDIEKLKTLRETFREEAAKSVKATFIVDALALAENVRVTEQEVQQTIYYEAMQMGQDPQATLDHYKKSGYLPAVQMAMVEDRLLSKLLNAKMKEA